MKHILRSPIEPEFAYFLKTIFRKKKEALQSRLRSERARLEAFFVSQKKNIETFLKRMGEIAQTWKETYQARGAVIREKVTAQAFEIPDKEVFSVPSTPEITASWNKITENIRKKIWSLGWTWTSRPVIITLFVGALLIGIGIKAAAHDSITIGFEDYKLSQSDNIVDLNALQERLLTEDGSFAPENALVGPQCTE